MSEYTGLTLPAVRDLDFLEYLVLRRDAYIHRLNQTEEGREYLVNAWRMEQTKPDRARLRAKYGKRGGDPNGE